LLRPARVVELDRVLLPDLLEDLAALLGVPRPGVGETAAAVGAVARAAERLGQVLGGNLAERAAVSGVQGICHRFTTHLSGELLLVAAAENLDLLDRDGVQPALDDGPDGGEDVGCVLRESDKRRDRGTAISARTMM
jgi:hypothetical protein